MRVLVTRPENASRRTATRLKSLGHETVILPLMEAHHHAEAVREALQRPHAALAITSAEAVRVLEILGDELAPHLDAPVFAVGEATAAAARAAGFRSVEAAEGTGASMVDAFSDRLRTLTSRHPLLYLAGTPRSPVFEEGLAARAIPLTAVTSYTMTPLPIPEDAISAALQTLPLQVILLYSRQTARVFFGLSPSPESLPNVRGSRILCLSENVADEVPVSLRPNIRIARSPDEDSLFALL